MQDFLLFISDIKNFSLFLNLVLGALAVFLSILVWRRTNEGYIVFFILGILFNYVEILYKTINKFSFIGGEILSVKVISLGLMIVEAFPPLCFIISLALFLKSKKI